MNSGQQRILWTLLGVTLLAILIYESGPRQIIADLSSVGIGLVAIILLEFTVDGFNTLGWWFTFPPDLRRGSYRRLFFVRLAGTALNQTIPAASIGGEPAKVYLLSPEFLAAINPALPAVFGLPDGKIHSQDDLKKLPADFAGRKFDAQLLADLPAGIDPCGENGEFHTCVVAGPMFAKRLAVTTGERVERDGYAYCDLVISPSVVLAKRSASRDP